MSDMAASEPGTQNRDGVFLGNINPGRLHHGFVMSLLESQKGYVNSIYLHPGPPYLDSNRNMVVCKFYETDDDKLLFVDSDQAWETDDITTLATICDADNYPIVGGVYYNNYATGLSPVIYEWEYDEEEFKQEILVPVGKDKWDKVVANSDNALIEVAAIGTGFMMIHRSVLDLMRHAYSSPTPWFAELVIPGADFDPETSNPRLYGEDLTFCCRAKALGIPIFAHSDVSITHYKEMTLKF